MNARNFTRSFNPMAYAPQFQSRQQCRLVPRGSNDFRTVPLTTNYNSRTRVLLLVVFRIVVIYIEVCYDLCSARLTPACLHLFGWPTGWLAAC